MKELARFLKERGIDPAGIVEKAELVAKVKEVSLLSKWHFTALRFVEVGHAVFPGHVSSLRKGGGVSVGDLNTDQDMSFVG